MARLPRIVYPGGHHHVMARGDQREAIIRDDEDRGMFFTTLAETVEKTDWQVPACVLLTNHYHWVIRTPGTEPGGRDEMVSKHLHPAYDMGDIFKKNHRMDKIRHALLDANGNR